MQNIISILQPSAGEEDLLLDLMERVEDGDSVDLVADAWNERLDVQQKKIWWEDLYKVDVDSRRSKEVPLSAAEQMEEPQQNVRPAEQMEEDRELLLPYMIKTMVKKAVADAMKDVYLRLEKLENAEPSQSKGKDGEEEGIGEKTDCETGFGCVDYTGHGGDAGLGEDDYRGHGGETRFDRDDIGGVEIRFDGDDIGGGEKAVGESGGEELRTGDGMMKLAAAVETIDGCENVGDVVGETESGFGNRVDEEPAVGKSIDEEPTVGKSIDEEQAVGKNVDEEQASGEKSLDEEPAVGKSIDEEQAVGKSGDEEQAGVEKSLDGTDGNMSVDEEQTSGEKSQDGTGDEVRERPRLIRTKMVHKKKCVLQPRRQLKKSIHVSSPFTEEKAKKEKKKEKEKAKAKEKEKIDFF